MGMENSRPLKELVLKETAKILEQIVIDRAVFSQTEGLEHEIKPKYKRTKTKIKTET